MDYTPFKYGRRKDGLKYNWEEIDSYKFTNKPVIFIFGGNLTTTTREANGYIKLVGSSLESYRAKEVDIIAASYEGEIAEKRGNEIALSQRAIFNAHNFFDKTIRPALDKITSISEMENFLSRMIFVGHSAGAIIINQIMDSMNNYFLYRVKDNKQMADYLMSDVQCFCYAPGAPIKQNVTAFYATPFFDRESAWKKLLISVQGDIKGEYPEKFTDNFDPMKPIAYTNNALKEHNFVAVRKGNSFILITGKLSDKNDHSIACLRNTQSEYSAFVSDCCEGVLKKFVENGQSDFKYSSFHDEFYKIKEYSEREAQKASIGNELALSKKEE
ncbi:MAG: hypothetical protein K6F08_01140 [bacterium]|nr:hypothetical protein [bacterium]